MEHVNNRSEDRETRAVLALASTPDIPGAAMDRLMARIAAEPQAAKVVAFTTRPARKAGFWRFATAVPLAASLALKAREQRLAPGHCGPDNLRPISLVEVAAVGEA